MGSAVPAGFKSLLNDFPLQILTEMNGKQRASEMYRTCFKKCMDTPIFHPHVIIPEVSARMYFHSALVRSNTDVGEVQHRCWWWWCLTVDVPLHPKCVDGVEVGASQVLQHQAEKTMSLWSLLCTWELKSKQERDKHKLVTQVTLLSKLPCCYINFSALG